MARTFLRIAASAIFMFAVVELGARMTHLAPPAYPEAEYAIVLHYTDPNGRVYLTPNWQGYVGFVPTSINEKGFRDRVFQPSPPSGVVRIAILGDSYTMGDAVPLEASYPKQLEAMYRDAPATEVMNCGVSATNTTMQVPVLEDVLRDYRPHLVVLGYNVNDFQWYTETRFERQVRVGQPFTVLADGRVKNDLSGQRGLKTWIRNQSYAYRAAAAIRDRYVQPADSQANLSKEARVQSWITAGGAEKSFEALGRMAQVSQRHGVPLVVAILPGIIDTSPAMPGMEDYPYLKEHDLMHQRMTALGIDFVDLLPAFAGENPRKLVAHPFDRHFSARGNELVAAALKKYLEPKIAAIRSRVPSK